MQGEQLLAIVDWRPDDGLQHGHAVEAGPFDGDGGDIDAQREKQPTEDWAAFNQRQRGDAGRFAGGDSTAVDLVIVALTLQPQARLMSRMLDVSADDWEETALALAQQDRANIMTRMQLYNSGIVTSEFFTEIARLLHQPEPWLILQASDRTWRAFSVSFAMLCRAAAGVYQLLAQRHRTYPFKLFGLLGEKPREVAEEILADPACVRCSFTNSFLAHWANAESDDAFVHPVDRLCSSDCKFTLLCAAIMLKTDTAKIECRHAAIRRAVLSSTTDAAPTEAASASFVLMRQRVMEHGLGSRKSTSQRKEVKRVRKTKNKKQREAAAAAYGERSYRLSCPQSKCGPDRTGGMHSARQAPHIGTSAQSS
jgi:hypothetical protein